MKEENDSFNIWYVIPTYWTGDKAGAFSSIYDHPTPIGSGESTLPRLLKSIVDSFHAFPKNSVTVLILISTVHRDEKQAALEWVSEICQPFFDELQILIAGEDVVEALVDADNIVSSKESLFRNGYRGYGDVRNLQLILPAIFGADWIYAIDDDELITKETVQRVFWHAEHSGDGIAGIYLNEDGNYLVNAATNEAEVANLLIDKGVYMNTTFEIMKMANDAGVFPVAPMALGGNMLFPKTLFWEVSFDPYITRGEDIDYLINAKARHFNFLFDFGLSIIHLPPRHLEADDYSKMKADVIRFCYELAKLSWCGQKPEAFYDYPGKLFEDDFKEEARSALQSIATKKRIEAFGSPQDILDEATEYALTNLTRYMNFAEDWTVRLTNWQKNEKLITKLWKLIHQ